MLKSGDIVEYCYPEQGISPQGTLGVVERVNAHELWVRTSIGDPTLPWKQNAWRIAKNEYIKQFINEQL